MGSWATSSGVGSPAAAARSPAMIDANAHSTKASKFTAACHVMEGGTIRSSVCVCVFVCVFFTLTDRASTIPSNICGCQSDTWSAGQENIRGTSTKI